ncbi:magnesium-dependent phosphatase 1-like [Macrosteles quadrilineatus]|uniref:magnesium-dependent phosphatase 1-like n=1 Tax=Macrosteles quadrilineatus TaxID=74068 RepID=UPI0023E1D1E7|nr:magnesium-dependent phosphatase 1-like [Macrosteles quadrilineatus]
MVDLNDAFQSASVFSKGDDSRPSVIVFDPDKTVWPFQVADLKTPLHVKNKNVIVDQAFNHLKIYRQIPSVFTELRSRGFKLALISQSVDNNTVCQLIDHFNLRRFLTHIEIYPGNKTDHFEVIHLKEDLWYGEMLYLVSKFEDVEPIADLGVACILVNEGGITMRDVRKGFHIFSTESPEYSYSEDTHESSYLFKE